MNEDVVIIRIFLVKLPSSDIEDLTFFLGSYVKSAALWLLW